MSYFADTICDHLSRQVAKCRLDGSNNKKMVVMIPTMPQDALLDVAATITNRFLQDQSLRLVLKIASILTNFWNDFAKETVVQNGWEDERGNLTFYRNLSEQGDTFLLVVLCGADRVTDSASLADFYTLDPDTVWKVDMKSSFQRWISKKLYEAGFQEIEEDLDDFDRIITPIYKTGCGDLLQISTWLNSLNLSLVENLAAAKRLMLSELSFFKLPRLTRFPIRQKSKSLSLIISKSLEFFNYTYFLDAGKRKKALTAINKIQEKIESDDHVGIPIDDEDVHGPYPSGQDFLDGLYNYIETDDPTERENLQRCDFVVIWDEILKFKSREPGPKKKPSVKKLSGSPHEIFLRSIYLALRDFCQSSGVEEYNNIIEISVVSTLFKHDIESGDDIEENTEIAIRYLTRLIGGLDSIISGHIQLYNEDGSDIRINSEILHSELTCKYGKSAEPAFEFSVTIFSTEFDEGVESKYAWRLPEHHMYRLSIELLLRAQNALTNSTDIHKLPVYHISYYDELLQGSSEEDIRRVLLHSIRDERENETALTNLLGDSWANQKDAVMSRLQFLAEKYDVFLKGSVSGGLYSSIFSSENVWVDLRKAYTAVFEEIKKLDSISQSPAVGLLTRAFLIIQSRSRHIGIGWYADYHEESGIVTILHPALLEMFEAQVAYLMSCFNYAVNRELLGSFNKGSFNINVWQRYVDLAEIQSPLSGLLYNEHLNLGANVRGKDLIHRIGTSSNSDTPISTKLLAAYREMGDEQASLADTEMFRETSESKLLLRLMLDYFDLHPHAQDGLNIAIFKNNDIQPIIAAVHAYLKILSTKPTTKKNNKRYILDDQRNRLYAISITLFTESSDETDVTAWVQQWRERWEAAETESKYAVYRRCRFSVAHRIVKIKKDDLSSFSSIIEDKFQADIAVFYNFIRAGQGVNRFERVEEFDIRNRKLKFPILEKACCSIDNPAEKYRRKRIVSNRQFMLSAYHANLLHSLSSDQTQKDTLVIGGGDFSPWRIFFDAIHKKAEWVVCVDPNMDERLIYEPSISTNKNREIIGFGSGVGTHGEDNYTISTEQFSLSDINHSLKASIKQLYGADAGWSFADCENVSKGVLSYANKLSGLSLVRATGVGDEHIRDFMANAVSRKMLRSDGPTICEILISLDAYRHWFDLSDNKSRPDLLWVRASAGEDNRIHLKMRLVECKMGQQSQEHLLRAKGQINNGLQVLISSFDPMMKEDNPLGVHDDRPDRRYWWMQLHRLIASKTEVSQVEYTNTLEALERLAEGDFDISWEASVFAFWINNDPEIKHIAYWNTGFEQVDRVNIYAIGGGFVKQFMTDPESPSIDWESLNNQESEVLNEEDVIIEQDESEEYGDWDDEDDHNKENQNEVMELQSESESAANLNSLDKGVGFNQDNSGFEQAVEADESVVIQIEGKHESSSSNKNEEDTEGGDDSRGNKIPQEPTLGRIFLGSTISKGVPVYWEFNHLELANRHILIFGSSGQGKTYAIQCLLCEMKKFNQNSLIVDYTNGFLPNHLEDIAKPILSPKQHVIRQEPLPINPFLPQESDSGGILIKENANAVAKRIAGLFDAVYNIGDQQFSVLHRAIMDGVESLKENMSLDGMISVVEEMTEDKRYKTSAQSLYNKLRPFVLDKPFQHGEKGFDWDTLFLKQDPLCNIFQLAGLDMLSGRLITEFILWDLYGHLQSKGKRTDPKVIVLDEVQNLDHREGSPLSKYLREGRKFGLSLILATQTMSNMKKDERDRMFNAGHKLFFRPADTELKAFADIAALATQQKVEDWVGRLASLKKGECYSIGPFLDPRSEKLLMRSYKIKIAALDERNLHE